MLVIRMASVIYYGNKRIAYDFLKNETITIFKLIANLLFCLGPNISPMFYLFSTWYQVTRMKKEDTIHKFLCVDRYVTVGFENSGTMEKAHR